MAKVLDLDAHWNSDYAPGTDNDDADVGPDADVDTDCYTQHSSDEDRDSGIDTDTATDTDIDACAILGPSRNAATVTAQLNDAINTWLAS